MSGPPCPVTKDHHRAGCVLLCLGALSGFIPELDVLQMSTGPWNGSTKHLPASPSGWEQHKRAAPRVGSGWTPLGLAPWAGQGDSPAPLSTPMDAFAAARTSALGLSLQHPGTSPAPLWHHIGDYWWRGQPFHTRFVGYKLGEIRKAT